MIWPVGSGRVLANVSGGLRQLDAPDAQAERIASARHEIALLARRKSARFVVRPHKWNPHTVRNPGTGEYFTDAGAWEFIADRLDAGEPLDEIELEKLPGKTGYALQIETDDDTPSIYIEVRLGSGAVIGMSFHYSIHS